MPGVRYSVFNPGGESYVPDTERFAAQQKSQGMSDWIALQAMANQRGMHTEDLNAGAASQLYQGGLQTNLQGTYAQRQQGSMDMADKTFANQLAERRLANQGGLDIANAGNAPAMGVLALQRSQWDDPNAVRMRTAGADEAGYRAAGMSRENDMNALLDGYVKSALSGGAAPGGAGGGGGFALNSHDLSDIVRKRAGLGADPADAFTTQFLAQQAQTADPSELPQYLEAIKSHDLTKLPSQAGRLDTRTVQELTQVKPLVADSIAAMTKFIRDNNWSIAGNGPELASLWNRVTSQLSQFRVSPQTRALIEGQMRAAMGAALDENGVAFKSYGTGAVKQAYGLQ